MTGSIVLGYEVLTMTSREIAELVDSRHDSVKRTIDRLVVQGVIESPPLVDFKNINNVAGQEYVFSGELGKRNSIIVVAQLSPEFTARLVDRWQELEAAQATDLSTDEGRLLMIQELSTKQLALVRENKEQAKALAEAAPKVEFVDSYVRASTGSLGFRQVCKLLKAKEPAFREFLLAEKIMYYLGGTLTAHQNHLDAGRFEVKTGVANSEHAYSSTKFSAKGVTWVAGEWAKHQARLALAEVAV